MVAFNFDATQHSPEFGAGGGGLPIGEYLGCIADSSDADTKDGKGKMMVFDLTPIEGPQKGNVQTLRLNLLNSSQQAVEIANKQLSAICFVIGVPRFNDTRELHAKPFRFVVGFQKGQEPSPERPNGGYTEVKKIKFADGREIGQTAPVQTQQNNGGDQAGWNGGGNPNPAPQQQQQQQQQQPQQNNSGWEQGGGAAPQANSWGNT